MARAADYVESVIDDLQRLEEQRTLAANDGSDLEPMLLIKGL